jgi:hypothetical protein
MAVHKVVGTMGAVVSIVAEWQSNVRFYSKSASQKLKDIANAFGFTIEPSILDDHEELATLRWKLQCGIGRDNPVATKALTKLFFAYLRGGHEFLYNRESVDQLLEKLIDQYRDHNIPTNNIVPVGGQLKVLESAAANPLIAKYHFLGYGRDDGLHLGLQCGEGSDGLAAVATFSPWDIFHADDVLSELGVDKSEILVLSRLLSVPGRRRVALSQFIAQLIGWVHREMRSIKAIATYCNPNAGHYGTVYRGANFIPLCYEKHDFVPFLGEEYVSPRKFQQLCDQHENGFLGGELRRGAVTPIPLLLYWYPVRGKRKVRHPVRPCQYPYPSNPFAGTANRNGGLSRSTLTLCLPAAE